MGTYRPHMLNIHVTFVVEVVGLVEFDIVLASRSSFCLRKTASIK